MFLLHCFISVKRQKRYDKNGAKRRTAENYTQFLKVYSKSEVPHLKYNDSCEVSEEQFGLLTISTWLRLWSPTIYSYVHEIGAIHDGGHFLPLKHKRRVQEDLAFL